MSQTESEARPFLLVSSTGQHGSLGTVKSAAILATSHTSWPIRSSVAESQSQTWTAEPGLATPPPPGGFSLGVFDFGNRPGGVLKAGTKVITLRAGQKGFIEVTEVYERLATFLGANAADHSAADKQLLCSAAESFMHIAKAAHEKGVRALGTYDAEAELDPDPDPAQAAELEADSFDPLGGSFSRLGRSVDRSVALTNRSTRRPNRFIGGQI